jgi:hypothetical protein
VTKPISVFSAWELTVLHPAMRVLIGGTCGPNFKTVVDEAGLHYASVSGFYNNDYQAAKYKGKGRVVTHLTINRLSWFLWRKMNGHLLDKQNVPVEADEFTVQCATCRRPLFRVHRRNDPLFRAGVSCQPSCAAMLEEIPLPEVGAPPGRYGRAQDGLD